jgi:hypothetical protein
VEQAAPGAAHSLFDSNRWLDGRAVGGGLLIGTA